MSALAIGSSRGPEKACWDESAERGGKLLAHALTLSVLLRKSEVVL